MLPVAVLSGGLATRLGSLTESVPKALLPIAGRPFIFHQLELLKREKIERVVLCVGHLGENIQAAVGDGAKFGLRVDYSFDGAKLRGTGGAIKGALPLLGESFFVLYGDSYLSCSFAAIQTAFQCAHRHGLLTVLRNEHRWDRSNVLFRSGEVLDYDKRSSSPDFSYIDYGLSIFDRAAFDDRTESDAFDLGDVVRGLAHRRQLAGFEVFERFYEIGSPEGIRDAESHLAVKKHGT